MFRKQCFLILLLGMVCRMEAQDVIVPNRYKQDDFAIHFGFCLGMNMMNFKVTPNTKDTMLANVSQPNPGFNIQIISNYRLGEYLDLRFLPGISFGERDVNYYNTNNQLVYSSNKLESNFLEFPLLLKYKSKRMTNIRPYVVTGGNFRIDLAHNYNEDLGEYLQLKRYDIYYEIGGGIDFYLEYFKLSVELKYSYGFLNMINRISNSRDPGYQNAIQQLRSVLTILSFHFE